MSNGNIMIALPSRQGWTVSWYTGEVRDRTRKVRGGTRKVVGKIRMKDCFTSTSREAVEAKAKEMLDAGYELDGGICECMF